MTDAEALPQTRKAAGAQFVFGQPACASCTTRTAPQVTGLIASDSNTGEYHQYNGDAPALSAATSAATPPCTMPSAARTTSWASTRTARLVRRDGSGIAISMRIGAKVEIATGGDMGSHAFIPLSPWRALSACGSTSTASATATRPSRPASIRLRPEPASRAHRFILSGAAIGRKCSWNQLAGHLAPKEWDAETVANMEATMEAAIGSGAEGDDTSGKFLTAPTLRGALRLHGHGRGREGQRTGRRGEVERRRRRGRTPSSAATPRPCGPLSRAPSTATPAASASAAACSWPPRPARQRQQVKGSGLELHQGLCSPAATLPAAASPWG